MNPNWDLLAYDKKGQLVLSVDVRRTPTASPEWAAELRKNVLARGDYPVTPYFLIALPDKFFLWKNGNVAAPDSEPNYTIDAAPIIEPYLKGINYTANDLAGNTLEFIISAWLGSLIYHGRPREEVKEKARWVVESGLFDAIDGGSLVFGDS
jgi:hypothetical protein